MSLYQQPSFVEYTGNGSLRQYAVPFPYLDRSHVIATVNGVDEPFTWVNSQLIELNSAPPNGVLFTIRRKTPSAETLVNFEPGSALQDEDLDLVARQALYVAQEAYDVANTVIAKDFDGALNAGGRRIKNLGTPTQPSDAVTKLYADQLALAAVEGQITGFGPRVLIANSGVEVSAGRVYKTLNEALAAAAALPLPPAPNYIKATIIAVGYFDEQVDRIPNDVHIVGLTEGSFWWTFTGNRTTKNWTVRPGYGTYVENCVFWLTDNENHETWVNDDDCNYVHLTNVKFLSRPPPGGNVIVQGTGQAKAITTRRSSFPFTFLRKNVLVDCDRSGSGGAIETINTASGPVPISDERAWSENVDTLFAAAPGAACYIFDGVIGTFLIGPQIIGNPASPLDSSIILRRTFATSGRTELHLVGQGVAPMTSPVEVNNNCTLIADYGITSVPVLLKGDGTVTLRDGDGDLIVRTSIDTYSARNLPAGSILSATSGGSLNLYVAPPPGVAGVTMSAALRPIGAGPFSVKMDLDIQVPFFDDFWRGGVVLRNSSTGELYFFGVRSGVVLALDRYSNYTTLAQPDVVAARSITQNPKYFRITRNGSGTVFFSICGKDGFVLADVASIAGLGSFDQIGVGASVENNAGVSTGVAVQLDSLVFL